MKAPFKDPINSKQKKSPKDFAAPTGDEFKMADGYGCGDNYGVGLAPKIGRERGSDASPIPSKSFRAAPKSLA